MSLNFDCVRDILFYLDENFVFKPNGKTFPIKLMHVLDDYPFNKYSREEVLLATKYLVDKKLVELTQPDSSPLFSNFKNITHLGHDFLAAVKDERVWNKVKKESKELAKSTIHQIISLALTYFSQG